MQTSPSTSEYPEILNGVYRCVSRIAPRFGIPSQEHQDLAHDVALSLVSYLGDGMAATPLSRPDAYIRACVSNACKDFRRREFPHRTRIHDAVIDTVRGRRNVSGLALWQIGGLAICGDARWDGSMPRDTPALIRLRQDTSAFDEHRNRNGIGSDVPSLVMAIFDWTATPLYVDELVGHIASIAGIGSENCVSLDSGGDVDADGIASAREFRDSRAGPDERAMEREVIAATALYACGLTRGRLGSWLFWLDRENVLTLFGACREPSAWISCFGDALEPAVTRKSLEDIIAIRDMPRAIRSRFSNRLEMPERHLSRHLRRVPLEECRIARLLSVTKQRVAYLRWCARQEFSAMRARVFDEVPH